MRFDFHTHTRYSDGKSILEMIDAAEEINLDAIGFSDHYIPSYDQSYRRIKLSDGQFLEKIYKKRSEAIGYFQDKTEVKLLEAIELDYHPDYEKKVKHILESISLDYSIGAVHFIKGKNLHHEFLFQDKSEQRRKEIVDIYFDRMKRLIESEMFDIVAHPDLVKRNSLFKDLVTDRHHKILLKALENSSTVFEINTGRIHQGLLSPEQNLLEKFQERGLRAVPGTDSHSSGRLKQRVNYFRENNLIEKYNLIEDLAELKKTRKEI